MGAASNIYGIYIHAIGQKSFDGFAVIVFYSLKN